MFFRAPRQLPHIETMLNSLGNDEVVLATQEDADSGGLSSIPQLFKNFRKEK